MNAEKYTQKTLDAVKTAQSMAQENGNQYLTPEHLLYALVDQDGGLIASLFGKMGVDCDGLLSELDTLIRRLPKVSGGSGEVYASPETGKILNLAEKTAEKLHDDYISVEHLMLAIFSEGTSDVKQLLQSHGITRSRFTDELSKVKTAPVTSDNPEETYDALKKYGTDLVERARSKELDPVIGRDAEIRNVIRILSRKTKNNPVLDRRAGRRQDRHRRGPCPAYRARRRARGAEGPHHLLARHGRAHRGCEVPWRVRGTPEGRSERGARSPRARSSSSSTSCTPSSARARPRAAWTRAIF